MAKREPIEVEVGGSKYLVGGIPPRQCLHILRKLSPFLGHLAPILADVVGGKDEDDQEGAPAPAEGLEDDLEAEAKAPPADKVVTAGLNAVPVLTDVLAAMPDATADYVLDGLLAGVKMVLPSGGAMPIVEGGRLKYANLEMGAQLELAGRSFGYNFESFFDALPSGFKDKARSLQTRFLG